MCVTDSKTVITITARASVVLMLLQFACLRKSQCTTDIQSVVLNTVVLYCDFVQCSHWATMHTDSVGEK